MGKEREKEYNIKSFFRISLKRVLEHCAANTLRFLHPATTARYYNKMIITVINKNFKTNFALHMQMFSKWFFARIFIHTLNRLSSLIFPISKNVHNENSFYGYTSNEDKFLYFPFYRWRILRKCHLWGLLPESKSA